MERDKIVAHFMCAMELALEDDETYIDFVHLMLRLAVDIIEEDFEGSEELEMIVMEEKKPTSLKTPKTDGESPVSEIPSA